MLAHVMFRNDTCYGPLAEHLCLPHLFIVTIRLPFFLYRECGRPLRSSAFTIQKERQTDRYDKKVWQAYMLCERPIARVIGKDVMSTNNLSGRGGIRLPNLAFFDAMFLQLRVF